MASSSSSSNSGNDNEGGLKDTLNATWKNDKSRFGFKMLQKMGWKEDKGLGKNESGSVSSIKVSKREEGLGLGMEKLTDGAGSKGWSATATSFNDILKVLNESYKKKTKVKKSVPKISVGMKYVNRIIMATHNFFLSSMIPLSSCLACHPVISFYTPYRLAIIISSVCDVCMCMNVCVALTMPMTKNLLHLHFLLIADDKHCRLPTEAYIQSNTCIHTHTCAYIHYTCTYLNVTKHITPHFSRIYLLTVLIVRSDTRSILTPA